MGEALHYVYYILASYGIKLPNPSGAQMNYPILPTTLPERHRLSWLRLRERRRGSSPHKALMRFHGILQDFTLVLSVSVITEGRNIFLLISRLALSSSVNGSCGSAGGKKEIKHR